MESLPEQSRRNCDGIMRHLRDYLEVREQQAVRINPGLFGIIGDMVWVQLENTRRVLLKPKSFGPDRIRVCDILASHDETKRRAMFHHADQNSILYEITDKQEDQSRKRVSEMAIHDMRTLYHALNPGLEGVIELLQHWTIWDLPDAADLYNFEVQIGRIEYVISHDIPEETLDKYRDILQKSPAESVTQREVADLEFHRLEGILHHFRFRRGEDEPFQIIIRRDEPVGPEGGGEPYDYKLSQLKDMEARFGAEKLRMEASREPHAAEGAGQEPATAAT